MVGGAGGTMLMLACTKNKVATIMIIYDTETGNEEAKHDIALTIMSKILIEHYIVKKNVF